MAPNGLQNTRLLTNDEKNWGMACHLSALCGFVGVPYGNVLGPLVVWLMKRNDSPFIDEQGKESLNFHISVAVYFTLSLISLLILVGFILLPLIYVFGLYCTIRGAIAASHGENYHYPLTIRFIQ